MALLIYLTLESGLHSRELLADLLWPVLDMQQARHNLRQTAYQVNKALAVMTGHDFLQTSRHHLGMATNAPYRADATRFSELLLHRSGGLADLEQAAALYKGPFLTNLQFPDAPGFEEWIAAKRELMHRQALGLFAQLSDSHENAGNLRQALPFALHYVQHEPWSEAGYLRAMRLHAALGEPDAALGQYEACQRVLGRELGVLPSEALQALAKNLRADKHIETPVSPAGEPTAMRRMMTVLYCELRAPNISDPEDALSHIHPVQARCERIVRRYFGHVHQVFGGGLLVYFGYPNAVENSAKLAVRAACAIAAESLPGIEIRLGVHSGPVLTSTDAKIPDPVGVTSSTAIELHRHARSAEVVVSAQTQKRIAGYFRFEPIEDGTARGRRGSIGGFRVVGDSGATHRIAATGQLTPFVGRHAELAQVSGLWMRAKLGEFQTLLIVGEAGIGKSRLVHALTERIDAEDGLVRELRCFAETRDSPLQPVINLCEQLCGIVAHDSAQARHSKLENTVRMRMPDVASAALPWLNRLLCLPDHPDWPLPELGADQFKGEFFKQLTNALLALTAHAPVLLIVEDVHWADASTLELLAHIARRGPGERLCMLMTARPKWPLPWNGQPSLELLPLPDADIAAMLAALHGDLNPLRRDRIVARAEGVPLFAEELAIAGASDDLPHDLHELMMTRLDKTGQAASVAQLAATLGREFDARLLEQASTLTPPLLDRAIGQLEGSGLLQRLTDGSWRFKHALLQAAAYESQTKPMRQDAHLRIARLLQSGFRGIAARTPEILAHHLTEAGQVQASIPVWLEAGLSAERRYAYPEALAHFRKGIAGLATLEPSVDRDRLECTLLVRVVRCEQVVEGYGNAHSMQRLDRALVLMEQQGGDPHDLFHVLWGKWEGAASSPQGHGLSIPLARRLVDIAAQSGEHTLQQQAHYALGNSLFWTGALAQAKSHLEQSIRLEHPDATQPTRDSYGRYMKLYAASYLAWVFCFQGDVEGAKSMAASAVAQARAHKDVQATAGALTFEATLYRWLSDVPSCRRLAQDALVLSREAGSLVYETANAMTLGWVEVMEGKRSAIASIEKGMAAIRQAMNGITVPLLALCAEALLHAGEAEKAANIAGEARQQAQASKDLHYLAELHHIEGKCRLACGDAAAARQAFHAALEVGKNQGAIFFVRRAEASLARVEHDGHR